MSMLENKPFILRPHHVELLIAAQRPSNPEAATRRLLDTAIAWRGTATSMTVDLERLASNFSLATPEDRSAYAVDLLGSIDAQTEKFSRSVYHTLVKFYQLADDTPVHLITGERDSICKGCAFQFHCASETVREEDVNCLQQIATFSAELGLADQVTSVENHDSPELRMEAGILRTIMWYFRHEMEYDIYGNVIL